MMEQVVVHAVTDCPPPSAVAVDALDMTAIPRLSGTDLATELITLPQMTLAQLRRRWLAVTGKPVPQVRATLLRLALAWEMQAQVYGGLSQRTRTHLAYVAGRRGTPARPGTRLLRAWNGVLHTVIVDDEGGIHWDGRTWRSLSEVARAITGTRWSGPAFFGLKQRKSAKVAA